MVTLLWLWPLSGLMTLFFFAAVSFWFDGRLAMSEWIRLWLTIMMALGPLGTLLSIRFLLSLIWEVRRENHRLKHLVLR